MRVWFQACRRTIEAGCVGALLVFGAGPAAAQQSVRHLEACLQKGWGFLDTLKFRFGTVNTCDKPVANWFMVKDGEVFRATVEPGGVFQTTITSRSTIEEGWIFAACPVGYSPDLAFADKKNWAAIGDSKYSCVKD